MKKTGFVKNMEIVCSNLKTHHHSVSVQGKVNTGSLQLLSEMLACTTGSWLVCSRKEMPTL